MSNTKYIQEGFTAITPYLFGKLELLDFSRTLSAPRLRIRRRPTARELSRRGENRRRASAARQRLLHRFLDGRRDLPLRSRCRCDLQESARASAPHRCASRSNETWGDRVGGVKDTSGNTWWIATYQGREVSDIMETQNIATDRRAAWARALSNRRSGTIFRARSRWPRSWASPICLKDGPRQLRRPREATGTHGRRSIA